MDTRPQGVEEKENPRSKTGHQKLKRRWVKSQEMFE